MPEQKSQLGPSRKKVKLVHQVQIFLRVFAAILDCERYVFRSVGALARELGYDAARGLARDRTHARDLIKMKA